MARPRLFPQTIEIPASALDVVEWLERNDRQMSFVGNGKHTAYLAWIEDGPMGMALGSYMPGPSPVKIAFEGYVTTDEGEPDVHLPFNALEVDPESQFRELEGLLFVTVQPKDKDNCLLTAELQDAEPMMAERVGELLEDLDSHFRSRRVAAARQRARQSTAAGEAVTQPLIIDVPVVSVGQQPLIAAPSETQSSKVPDEVRVSVDPGKRRTRRGRKAPPPDKMRSIVQQWRAVEAEESTTQDEFAEEMGISARTLRNYITAVEGSSDD